MQTNFGTMPVSAESVEALNEALSTGLRLHQDGELRRAEYIYRQILGVFPDLPEALYLLGLIAQQTGNHAEACELALRALDTRPNNGAYRELLGHALRGQKRFDEALDAYGRAAAVGPDKPELLIGKGLALKGLERFQEAAAAFRKATEIAPTSAEAWVNLGNVQRKTDEWTFAVTSFERAISAAPELAEAHNNLGAALIDLNNDARATECFQRALGVRPCYVEPMYNLGRVDLLNDRAEGARTWLRKAVEVAPGYADAWVGLGIVHASLGDMQEMLFAFRKAIELRPTDADTFFSLGLVLLNHGQPQNAARLLEHGLGIEPDSVAALNNLAAAQHQLGKPADALESFRKLFALVPEFPDAQMNHANLLISLGRVTEALEMHRRLLARDPDSRDATANVLLDLCYLCEDPDELDDAHRRWPQARRTPLPAAATHDIDRDAERRLRIGLVSADLRTHSVAYFSEPLFRHLDRERFEIHVYANTWMSDGITERLKAQAAGWRRIAGVPDAEVVRMIREDAIDILIDVSGHTGGNRLMVFAHKPAPVQACWLGYPSLTGLPAMDYRITDWQVDPPRAPEGPGELPVRLAHSYFCFNPPADAPAVGALPALRNGYITFGSFNNLAKLSSTTLSLWKKLLSANGNSRLMLKCKGLGDPGTQARLREQLCTDGIGEKRLVMLPWETFTANHLELYNRVDIAVDSFPYNGATTTCEALWMGVPVVSLAGATHPARMGLSILSAAGLPELVASTPEEYIALASGLAADCGSLASLRAGLRQRLQGSPLRDEVTFARNFGGSLRWMWVQACERTAR